MPLASRIAVQMARGDAESGVCAQDFETSIQSHLTDSHLLGLLNFSAIWNKMTHIYDTAIGEPACDTKRVTKTRGAAII